jgi:hypothetical protein
VHNTYASQSRACVIHLRMKLASTRKGDTPMTSYFTKMKEYTDEMAVAGKQLEDDDIVSYILTGLDAKYNGLVENVSLRADLISLNNLFAQLLAAEVRNDNQSRAQMSANTVARGSSPFRGQGGHDGGCGCREGSRGFIQG